MPCITMVGIMEVVVPLFALGAFMALGYVMGRADFLSKKQR